MILYFLLSSKTQEQSVLSLEQHSLNVSKPKTWRGFEPTSFWSGGGDDDHFVAASFSKYFVFEGYVCTQNPAAMANYIFYTTTALLG
jgi:hypothetical protein